MERGGADVVAETDIVASSHASRAWWLLIAGLGPRFGFWRALATDDLREAEPAIHAARTAGDLDTCFEVAAFAPGHAMATVSGPTVHGGQWRRECSRIAEIGPPRPLPLTIWLPQSDETNARLVVEAQAGRAREIFGVENYSGIDVCIESWVTWDEKIFAERSRGKRPEPAEQLEQLVHTYASELNERTCHVFVLRQNGVTRGFFGRAASGGPSVILLYWRCLGPTPETLAHELGHALGLPHEDEPSNVMSVACSRSFLSPAQCYHANTSVESVLNRLAPVSTADR